MQSPSSILNSLRLRSHGLASASDFDAARFSFSLFSIADAGGDICDELKQSVILSFDQGSASCLIAYVLRSKHYFLVFVFLCFERQFLSIFL